MCRISFIIPVYNCGCFIPRCVESIENQFNAGKDDYEIIIINDGSTDNTWEIINTLASKNPQIKLIDKPNGGVSSARNEGIKMVKGKYVYFVDSDDFLFPLTISRQLDIMDSLELDTMKVGYEVLASNDMSVNQCVTPPHLDSHAGSFRVMTGQEWLIEDKGWSRAPWQFIHRTEILHKHNIQFDVRCEVEEDLLFNIHLISYSKRFAVSSIPTYAYVYYSDSACHRRRGFEESFRVGIGNVMANLHLSDNLKNRSIDKRILYTLDRIRDYNLFARCLWPLIRDARSPREAKRCICQFIELGIYPVSKPKPGYINMDYSWRLSTLWNLSRYKYVFLFVISVRFLLSKLTR